MKKAMMNNIKKVNMKNLIVLLGLSVLLISCDKDFNTIGTDLVNEDHFDINTLETTTVATENFRLEGVHPVQTDNLPYTVLGYYNDPIYGNTTANVLSQVELSEYGKDFGSNPVITKVILSIPYYSRKISTDDNGASTYELDSVYGTGEMKISLYKSDYFLNDFDPSTNFEERQKYYSDADATFAPHSFGNPANLIYEKLDLNVAADELEVPYVDDAGDTQKKYFSPRLRDSTNLDIADFNWLIDPNNATAISTKSEFKNFYRGIYIKTELATGSGTFFGVDLAQVNIEVKYEYDDPDGGVDPLESSIRLLFSGNRVNTFTNNFSYTEDADKIYLKGGEGAMVKIDLFDPVSDDDRTSVELSDIQDQAENWLINEANIEFYVDENPALTGTAEPERVFLYDIKNNKVLLDYLVDANVTEPLYSKVNHLGRLERDATGKGVKYKIMITEHIKNIIKNDSTNVKLGLVVSNNVNLLGSSDIKGVNDPESISTSSITSHQGTVLYNENAIAPKKLKLKIHYTKVN